MHPLGEEFAAKSKAEDRKDVEGRKSLRPFPGTSDGLGFSDSSLLSFSFSEEILGVGMGVEVGWGRVFIFSREIRSSKRSLV